LCALLNIIITFFLAYQKDGSDHFEYDFAKIRIKYTIGADGLWYTSRFFYELMIFLPLGMFGHINDKLSFLKILWLIKFVRIEKMFKYLNSKYYKPIIRNWQQKKLGYVLQDSKINEDIISDHLHLSRSVYVQNFLKLLKLILSFIVFSYILGTFWVIAIKYSNGNHNHGSTEEEGFFNYHGFSLTEDRLALEEYG
jgi:hypothetical protein